MIPLYSEDIAPGQSLPTFDPSAIEPDQEYDHMKALTEIMLRGWDVTIRGGDKGGTYEVFAVNGRNKCGLALKLIDSVPVDHVKYWVGMAFMALERHITMKNQP